MSDNFVKALDKQTMYESETLHPKEKVSNIQYGNVVNVTTTMIHRVRPEKKYIKIGVDDIVKNGLR